MSTGKARACVMIFILHMNLSHRIILGRILFDAKGYWIYDGQVLSIAEQEQVAKFIMNYVEVI